MDVEELRRNYPAFLVSANRLMNLCYAMKCGEVCGEKLIDAYRPTPDEIDQRLISTTSTARRGLPLKRAERSLATSLRR